MKSQASAALGTVIVWLLINNAAVVANLVDQDLGNRAESIQVQEIDPLISQLALAALVGSAVIWLIGGLIRRLIALVDAGILLFLLYRLFTLINQPASSVSESVTYSGDVSTVDLGISLYVAFAVSLISALLYLVAVRVRVIDRSARPNLKPKTDLWREQDEGRDATA
jgi:ABC-type branched-subunit amino acid transport system permease subunit